MEERNLDETLPPGMRSRLEAYDDGVRYYLWLGSVFATLLMIVGVFVTTYFAFDLGRSVLQFPNVIDVVIVVLLVIAAMAFACGIVYFVFSREEFLLTSVGVVYRKGIRPDRGRRVPLDEVIGITVEPTRLGSVEFDCLKVKTTGYTIDFGTSLSAWERGVVLRSLKEWFEAFGLPRGVAAQPILVPVTEGESEPDLKRRIIRGTVEPATRPSESRHRLLEEPGRLIYRQGGRTPREWMLELILTVVGFGLMASFFGGMLVSITQGLNQVEGWVMLVVVSGIAIAAGWGIIKHLITLALVPFRRTRVVFEAERITTVEQLFRRERREVVTLKDLDRLELHLVEPEDDEDKQESETDWSLHFIDSEGESVFELKELAHGEGHWIGQHWLKEFRSRWPEAARF